MRSLIIQSRKQFPGAEIKSTVEIVASIARVRNSKNCKCACNNKMQEIPRCVIKCKLTVNMVIVAITQRK